MRTYSKTRFIEAAKNWDVREIEIAICSLPDWMSVTDRQGRSPLHLCAGRAVSSSADSRRSIRAARLLLDAGADVNAVHGIADGGEVFPATALWFALARGRNRPLARFLLDRGADPAHCMFALVYADDLVSARLLRRYGAQLDEVIHGETPLIYAVRHRRDRFAEWLLREGADACVRDVRGFTALHHAVRRRLPDSTLRLLVRRGAAVDAVSTDGSTVGSLATRAQRGLLGIEDE